MTRENGENELITVKWENQELFYKSILRQLSKLKLNEWLQIYFVKIRDLKPGGKWNFNS